LRGERTGELPLFDYGPSIEELRRTSLADTGLPAPRPPGSGPISHLLAAE
jgi:N-methylhydantoinase B